MRDGFTDSENILKSACKNEMYTEIYERRIRVWRLEVVERNTKQEVCLMWRN
jgi:hypothetical protein